MRRIIRWFQRCWQRLGRKPQLHPSSSAPTPDSERRRSPRHLSTVEIPCTLLEEDLEESFTAMVRDISTSGIALVLGKCFEMGTIFTLQLENVAANSSRLLLARVVRTQAQDNGRWLHGCAFMKHISAEELGAFEAEGVKALEDDYRFWVRFPCHLETSCCLFGEQETFPVYIVNISPSGMGIHANRPFDIGSLLHIEMPHEIEHSERTILGRVVHATPQSNHIWMVGCTFPGELSQEELQKLL